MPIKTLSRHLNAINYLGSVITQKTEIIIDIKTRMALAKASFNRMKSTLISKKITMSTKLKLLKCYKELF